MIHSWTPVGELVVAVNVMEVPTATETGWGETLREYTGAVREMLPSPWPQLRRQAVADRTTNETEHRKTLMLASIAKTR
jgi:hypothetical protein